MFKNLEFNQVCAYKAVHKSKLNYVIINQMARRLIQPIVFKPKLPIVFKDYV